MLMDLLIKNRSYRGYDQSRALTQEELTDMVNHARFTNFSQNYQAFKYYLSWTPEQNAVIQPLTGWARNLPDMKLPHPGHEPTGFIVICYDKTIGPGIERFWKDVGSVATAILLRATEMGLGGCMIGNFNPQKVREALHLGEQLQPILLVALGKPDEQVVLTDLAPGGDFRYYRDENDVHYVPKRRLEELILNDTPEI